MPDCDSCHERVNPDEINCSNCGAVIDIVEIHTDDKEEREVITVPNPVKRATASEVEIDCGHVAICFFMSEAGELRETHRIVLDPDGGSRVPDWQYKKACAQAAAVIKEHREAAMRLAKQPIQLPLL